MSEESKISVEKIEIKIGRKMLTLTPAEMKELRDILDATFPKKETVYIPHAPIIIERPWIAPKPWRHWDTSWSTNAGGKSTLCVSHKA